MMDMQEENDVEITKKRLIEILPPSDTSNPEGIKKSFHGNIYQVRLSLNYGFHLWETIKDKSDFALASEVVGGEKLDDLVVYTRVDNDDKNINVLFLQAKHSLVDVQITETDLLKDADAKKTPFSLAKYFASFLLIRKSTDLKIRNCILCTNRSLDQSLKNIVKENSKVDLFFKAPGIAYNILSKQCIATERFTRHQYESRNGILEKIYEKLKNVDLLKVLAKILLAHLCHGTNDVLLNKNNPVYKAYHGALVKENILVKLNSTTCKLHPDFKNRRKKLGSSAARSFQKIFFEFLNDRPREYVNSLLEKELKCSKNFGIYFQYLNAEVFKIEKTASELILFLNKEGNKNVFNLLIPRKAVGFNPRKQNHMNYLAGYIFVNPDGEKSIKFRSSFFNIVEFDNFLNLVPDITDRIKNKMKGFRSALMSEIKKINLELNEEDLENKFKELQKYRFEIKGYLTCFENDPLPVLPEKVDITDDLIDEFLIKFILAVNQPNEEKLGTALERKLRKVCCLNDATLISNYMFSNAVEWMKNVESGYRDGIDIDNILMEGKQKMATIALTSPTLQYCNRLKEYGNNYIISALDSFIKDDCEKQIIWLETGNPILLASNVEATLKEQKIYHMKDGFVFNSLSFLAYVSDEVTLAFQGDTNLIVIVIEDEDIDEEVVNGFLNNLVDIIEDNSKMLEIINNKRKKLVIIAKENQIYLEYFNKCKLGNITLKHNAPSETDPDPSKKSVKFQGEYVLVRDLVDGDNTELSERLMTMEKPKIGKSLQNSCVIKNFNIKETYFRENKVTNVLISNNDELSWFLSKEAKTIKIKYSTFWVAKVGLREILNERHQNPEQSIHNALTNVLNAEFSNDLERDVFLNLCKKDKIILFIDGYNSNRFNIKNLVTFIDNSMMLKKWILLNKASFQELNSELENAAYADFSSQFD